MSKVEYSKCDICGEVLTREKGDCSLAAVGERHFGIIGRMLHVDVCKKCWDRIKREVEDAREGGE